jgi:hypothetical protein
VLTVGVVFTWTAALAIDAPIISITLVDAAGAGAAAGAASSAAATLTRGIDLQAIFGASQRSSLMRLKLLVRIA